MSVLIAVTRNIPGRFRGLLTSCMLEIAPGTFVSPQINRAVRERIWDIMMSWNEVLRPNSGVVFLWPDTQEPSHLGMSFIGFPPKELIEHDGFWLARSPLTKKHRELLALDSPS